MISRRAISIKYFARDLNNAGIETGERRLFAWLRKEGYLDERNIARPEFVRDGLFEVCRKTFHLGYDNIPYAKTLITRKGMTIIKKKLKLQQPPEYVYSGMGLLDEI